MPRLISNPLKPRLLEQPYVIGTFLEIPSPALVELLGLAGFDFVIVDREHGPIDLSQTEDLIRAGAAAGISVMVRVPDAGPVNVRLPLDMGAAGVHVPQIESFDLAEQAVRAAKFHPKGFRGMQPYVRAASYRAYPTEEFLPAANDQGCVVLHIEGTGGIADIGRILALEDLDVAFLGPYDLSQSLGIPGQVNDPRVVEKMEEVVLKAQGGGTLIGTYCDNAETARMWRERGVRYLAVSLDARIFLSAARDLAAALRA